jgi:hypothetical protein
MFEDLSFKFPEQEGSKTQPRNKYTKKQKAAIRHAALNNLLKMLDDSKYLLNREELRPRVEAELSKVPRPFGLRPLPSRRSSPARATIDLDLLPLPQC